MKQYKVLEIDFCGESDLEKTLNDYANDEWSVVSILPTKKEKNYNNVCTTESFIIIFEK